MFYITALVNSFWSYLLYLVIFMTLYFSIEKFFAWDKVRQQKHLNIVENVTFGSLAGVVTLLCQLVIEVINSRFYLPLFVSTMILITIFKDYLKALVASIPGFIHYALEKYANSHIYLTIVFSLLIVLMIVYAKTFVAKKHLHIINFLLLFGFFITLLISALVSDALNSGGDTLVNLSFVFFFTIFGYLIMIYLVGFVKSSRLLYDSSRYQFLNFFRPSIAIPSINNFLIENKISYGYIVLFRFRYNKDYANHITKALGLDLEEHFYQLLQDRIFNKGVLFSYSNDENGFFIPATKSDLQQSAIPLELSQIVRLFNARYTWDQEEIPFKIGANFGIAKYGVDSQSVSRLISYASFALNEQPQGKQVVFFDWRLYNSFVRDNHDVNAMDKTFQLDNLSKTFTPLYDVVQKKHFGTYTLVESNSDFHTYETTRDQVYIKNYQNVFDRYFASDFLLQTPDERLLVYYAPTIFENEFLFKRFQDFFARNRLHYEHFHLVFDRRGLDLIKNHRLVKRNLQSVIALGVKIVVPCGYPKAKLARIINKVDYAFVRLTKTIGFKNNYPEAQLICFEITSAHQVLLLFRGGVTIFGGPLFNREFSFAKFSKQSRIYLESIIKEAKHG